MEHMHFIFLDGENRIIDGWSDGLFPDKPTDEAICINEQGGYQFRLFPDGEENPALIDSDGVHLWKWVGEVLPTTEEERTAERASFPQPAPEPDVWAEMAAAYQRGVNEA